MTLHTLNIPDQLLNSDAQLLKQTKQFNNLITEINKRALPDTFISGYNLHIDQLNSSRATSKDLTKMIKKTEKLMVTQLEKEHKIVPKNYYRNIWLPLGIGIGLPFGLVFASLIKNMGLMAIGLPIGIGIGAMVGSSLDKKAAQDGRQLDIELK